MALYVRGHACEAEREDRSKVSLCSSQSSHNPNHIDMLT